jgi:hypothetical protein
VATGILDGRLPQRRLADSRFADNRERERSLRAQERLNGPQL